ncbi:MAG TPA: hypothetical protein VKC17_03345 [Sphingomicrobium sp.]|nr:hypothetical protein [Sphingomicrobium sp.]
MDNPFACEQVVDPVASAVELIARESFADCLSEAVIISNCCLPVGLVELDACEAHPVLIVQLEVVEALDKVGNLAVVKHRRTPQKAKYGLGLKVKPPRPAPGEHDVMGEQASQKLAASNGVAERHRDATTESLPSGPCSESRSWPYEPGERYARPFRLCSKAV